MQQRKMAQFGCGACSAASHSSASAPPYPRRPSGSACGVWNSVSLSCSHLFLALFSIQTFPEWRSFLFYNFGSFVRWLSALSALSAPLAARSAATHRLFPVRRRPFHFLGGRAWICCLCRFHFGSNSPLLLCALRAMYCKRAAKSKKTLAKREKRRETANVRKRESERDGENGKLLGAEMRSCLAIVLLWSAQ